MDDYMKGLAHGRVDERESIQKILELDISDAMKLEMIAQQVRVPGGVS